MIKRDAIFPAGRQAIYDIHRYSAAVRAGDLVFVSGQVGSREDGTPVPDYEDQVRQAFANLRAVLAAAGGTLDNIVDVTTFHTHPSSQFDRFLTIKDENFPASPFPAWTAMGVDWLAGFDFEIKVVAHIPATG
jgi:enamine deaminase RidA (YjgF/YER057c/UK114 family)